MGECNTILSAYTKYRHLGWCCTHPSIYLVCQNVVLCGNGLTVAGDVTQMLKGHQSSTLYHINLRIVQIQSFCW